MSGLFKRAEDEARAADPMQCTLADVALTLSPPMSIEAATDKVLCGSAATGSDDEKREIEWCRSAPARVLDALGADWLDAAYGSTAPRVLAQCPSCGQPERFSIAHEFRRSAPRYSVRAACSNGCSAEQLGAALSALVTSREREQAEQQRTREVERTIAAFAPTDGARPLSWVVPDLAAERTLTIVNAVSGGSKTWLLESLALAVASGRPLLGREVTRGPALLILLESYEINFARIEPLAEGLGTSFERELLRRWLHVWPRGEPFKTEDPVAMKRLAQFVRVLQPSLIAIDNLTEIRIGTSQSAENDSTVMSNVLRPLAVLAHEGVINGERVTDRPPAIVLAHHDRGSSAVEQHADLVLKLSGAQRPEAPVTISRSTGCRVLAPGLPMQLRFRGLAPDPVVPELVDRAPRNTEPEAKPRHERIAAALRKEPGQSLRRLAAAAGMSLRDVGPTLREMADLGLVVEADAGGWSLADGVTR